MLKSQVKPFVGLADASNYLNKPNSMIEYPNDMKGDEDKMIEYGNEMISLWTMEVQGLQERKEVKEAGDVENSYKMLENAKEKKLNRRQTLDMADQLKATLKKEVIMNQKQEKSESKENNQIGLLRPSLLSKKFNINKTIATILFGEDFFLKPSVKLILVLMSFYIVSVSLTFLALWHFIPSYFVHSNVVAWPLLLYFYTVLCNIDIFILILRQQQTIIYILWCFVFYVSMLIEYRTQDNYAGIVTAWGTVLTSFLAVSLFDSITNIDIRMIYNKLLMPGCFGICCLHQIAMFLNWSEIPQSNNFQLFGHINMSMTALGSSSLNNGIILIGLNIISAYMNPHSLIMVKSRVEAVLLSEEEAVALRAMDQIGSETAEANKQHDIVEVMTEKIVNKLKFSLSPGKVLKDVAPVDK